MSYSKALRSGRHECNGEKMKEESMLKGIKFSVVTLPKIVSLFNRIPRSRQHKMTIYNTPKFGQEKSY